MIRPNLARRTTLIVLSAAGLMMAAVTTGCGVRPPLPGRQDPHARGQIHFVDPDLQDRTAARQVNLSRDEGDLLHVMVPIRNTTNEYQYIEYRVTFFDRNKQVLTQSAWLRKDLAPNTPDQVTANSTSPRADDVQVDFRKGRVFRP